MPRQVFDSRGRRRAGRWNKGEAAMSYQEIGKKMGLSHMMVQKIAAAALAKMREEFRNRGISEMPAPRGESHWQELMKRAEEGEGEAD